MLTKCQQKKIVAARSLFDLNDIGDGFTSLKAAENDSGDRHAIELNAGHGRATSKQREFLETTVSRYVGCRRF